MKKPIEGKHLGPFKLLPAKEGTCPECATDHEKELPHNKQSMFYQYAFYNEHGRWPTWADAMAHCSEKVRTHWTAALLKLNQKIEE